LTEKKFEIAPIPEGHKRGWEIHVNGVRRDDVNHVEFKSRFGELPFGLRPEGYDGWAFHETGGGGAVTLPYTVMDGDALYVGLIKENRPNMGGEQLCIVGGFIAPGETHAAAQVRGADEEAGLNSASAVELPGLPFCSNRLFFVADPAKGEGMHAYALEIPKVFVVNGDNGLRYDIPEELRPKFGKIVNVTLLPVFCAIQATADALALAAIARLLAFRQLTTCHQ
jgi:hypothetical protein